MRRLTFLLTAGLLAAPLSSALAQPPTVPPAPPLTEKHEWSASKRRLGVMVMTLTPELRTHFGSTDKTGVLVGRVEPGSPAAMAGIAVGDVITEVRGTQVDDAMDIITTLAGSREPQVGVKVLRDRKPQSFEVRLDAGTRPSSVELPAPLRWLRDMLERPDQHAST